jgi:hypothetical protein
VSRNVAIRSFRLEIRRRWQMLLFFVLTGPALSAAAWWLGGDAVILVAMLAVVFGLIGFAASWGTVALDRQHGRFDALRGLPVPLSAMARGRLMLTALWAGTLPLGLSAAIIGLHRAGQLPLSLSIAVRWLLVLWLLAAALAVLLTALTARWPLERWFSSVFGAGYFIGIFAWPWLGPLVMPHLQALTGWFASRGADGVAVNAAMAVGLASLAAAWWPATRLLAWGMAVAPSGPPERQAALERRREIDPRSYPRGRGSTVTATAALHLRLALERLPRQLLVLVAGLLVIPWLPSTISTPALIYLRVLAVALPASIIGRIMIGRTEGLMEPFAALPVRRSAVALGVALAIAVLALLASLVMSAATAIAGGGELDPLLVTQSWALLTGTTMFATGMAVWLRTRTVRIAIGLGGVLLLGLVWLLKERESVVFDFLLRAGDALAWWAGRPFVPLVPLLLGGGIGVLVFTRGLGRLPERGER